MKSITLASGSKGNATFIQTEKRKFLIDLGLSFKELKSRLSLIHIEPYEISAIFITHEHCDHIKGISTFLKKCPSAYVYVHTPNYENVKSMLVGVPESKIIAFDKTVEFEDVCITAFPVSHDSFDCVGYQVCEGQNKMAIATDLGYFTQEIIDFLTPCSLVILEANHDVEKLINNSHYPPKTKARILSGKGHLSNNQCAELSYILAKYNVRQLILAHLSEENNTPSLAYNTISGFLKSKNIIEGQDIYIDVASQNKIGNFFLID